MERERERGGGRERERERPRGRKRVLGVEEERGSKESVVKD